MSRDPTTTLEQTGPDPRERREATPGALLFLAGQRPRYEPYRIGATPLLIGRGATLPVPLDDSLASREHAQIGFQAGHFMVADLGSRNGTFVDGERLEGTVELAAPAVVRIGGSLLLLSTKIDELALESVGVQGGIVLGPALRNVLKLTTRAGAYGKTLLIVGETGSGKELVARHFHDHGPHSTGPFVVANCGAIPEGVAERVLFGSRRGAFSGATDATGFAQRAHGGTLFLDELGELPLAVQVKLLRLLESGEVQRLGVERPERVDVNVCAATWRDLRSDVAAGRFREDLYFRIAKPQVRLPPLRERLYEIPWHVADELSRLEGGVNASAEFIEQCALRPWPGNVRELRAEVREAAALAAEAGRVFLTADDLGELAGTAIESASPAPSAGQKLPPEDETAAALRAEQGNVAAAARRLGVHRNKVRRWLERHGIDPKSYRE